MAWIFANGVLTGKPMNRQDFRKQFTDRGPAIFTVIHVQDSAQAIANARAAMDGGAHGVFLINHDFPEDELIPAIRDVREALPDLWMGINFLGVTGARAFPKLAELQNDGVRTDAYWGDDARIDERTNVQTEAEDIAAIREKSGWSGLYFGGTAFKKQRPVDDSKYELSARIATSYMDVVTTSGVATGRAADAAKIETFRLGCKDHPLGLASGVTPENIADYREIVDAILVATGINFENDFYNIDPARLALLMAGARQTS